MLSSLSSKIERDLNRCSADSTQPAPTSGVNHMAWPEQVSSYHQTAQHDESYGPYTYDLTKHTCHGQHMLVWGYLSNSPILRHAIRTTVAKAVFLLALLGDDTVALHFLVLGDQDGHEGRTAGRNQEAEAC